MKPTNYDLKRLVDEQAADDLNKDIGDAPESLVVRALAIVSAVMLSMARGLWGRARLEFIAIARLCLHAAWEAGKRVVPQDPPTAAETPEAKGASEKTGVEALLERATLWRTEPMAPLVADLAAALRAERERADKASEAAGLAYTRAFDSQEHLRAVLRTGWAHSAMAPTVVQKARVFLEGQAAPLHDDAREIELLRKELAEKGAALDRATTQWSVACRERDDARSALNTERLAHEATAQALKATRINEQSADPNQTRYALRCAELRAKEAEAEVVTLRQYLNEARGERDEMRAAVVAEEEVHAHTRAELANARADIKAVTARAERAEQEARDWKEAAKIAICSVREQVRNLDASCERLAKGDW